VQLTLKYLRENAANEPKSVSVSSTATSNQKIDDLNNIILSLQQELENKNKQLKQLENDLKDQIEKNNQLKEENIKLKDSFAK